jgi:hypothetical protein
MLIIRRGATAGRSRDYKKLLLLFSGRRLQAVPVLAIQRTVPFFEPFCLVRK